MNEHFILAKNAVSGYNLIAATGEKHYEKISKALEEKGVDTEKLNNVKVVPYIYNMEEIFSAADMIVGRAGAITISEITAAGKAAVLIPSPYVAHNHQEHNARYLEKNGAAKVVVEGELSGERLAMEINTVLGDTAKLKEMQKASKSIGICDACETIYKAVKNLV